MSNNPFSMTLLDNLDRIHSTATVIHPIRFPAGHSFSNWRRNDCSRLALTSLTAALLTDRR